MNPASLTTIMIDPAVFKPDNPNTEMSVESTDADIGDQPAPKPWMKRSGAAIIKVAPDVKRRRKNYQARKLLAPKNPLMILNELRPGLIFKFDEKTSELSQSQNCFIATVEIDGKSFCGQGPNKKQSQQEAAEAALRGLYFDKLLEHLVKKEDGDVDMKDNNQSFDNQIDATPSFPEDDTPWSGLASLAMYKLVSLWQVPSQSISNSVNVVKAPTLTAFPTPFAADLKTKLPPNSSEMDPVMLLNQISPQSKFNELTRDVRNGATVFTLTVNFNGESYTGSATKKKIAKKLCAKSALKSLGVVYDDEGL